MRNVDNEQSNKLEWWADFGDWTYSQNNSYDTYIENNCYVTYIETAKAHFKIKNGYNLTRQGKDLTEAWYFALTHRKSAVDVALKILKEHLDKENSKQDTIMEFLDCFIVALYMVDDKTKNKFLAKFKILFPDFQYKSNLPDDESFLNHFFEITDLEIIQHIDRVFGYINTATNKVWDVINTDVRETITKIKEIDENFEGNIDISKVLESILESASKE